MMQHRGRPNRLRPGRLPGVGGPIPAPPASRPCRAGAGPGIEPRYAGPPAPRPSLKPGRRPMR